MSVGFVPGLVGVSGVAAGPVFWDLASSDAGALPGGAKFFNGGEGPDYAANPWDRVTLNNVALPGICSAQGLPRFKFDKKPKGGSDSMSVTGTGYLPGPINISCTIWTASQWSLFLKAVPRIWRKPNKAKISELAVPFYYSGLAHLGIDYVIVEGMSSAEPGPYPQSKVIKILCQQFVPPDKVNRTQKAKSNPQFPPNAGGFPSFGIGTLRRPENLNVSSRPSDHPPGPKG